MSKQDHTKPLLVAGVGASAGGLEALKRFFRAVPGDCRLAFIVVQHLDPTHKSMIAEILNRDSDLTFCQAEDEQKIQANCVYVIPPGAYIEVEDHSISLIKPAPKIGSRMAIDHLFRSMAEVYQTQAVGLLFSGAGSDGTAGLRALKAAGGLVIVQDPQSAQYPSMPLSAINAGIVDQVVRSVEDIPDLLIRYTQHTSDEYHQRVVDAVKVDELKPITRLLKTQENIDLNQYKASTVERRISRRMTLSSIGTLQHYTELLNKEAGERQRLMRDLLIGVTDFFRDKEAFERLDQQVLKKIVEQTEDGGCIRVWVAGCASGEEAYTIAMMLLERVDRTDKAIEVKIFATDVDEEAVKLARKGVYPASIIMELPEHYRQSYFSAVDETHFVVTNKIRSRISFAVQNIFNDPPFSKVNLVSCRNVLIYLKRSVQQKVFQSFYFALQRGGYLFLGTSESIGEQKELFKTLSSKWRIYQRQDGKELSLRSKGLPRFLEKSDLRSGELQQKKTARMSFSEAVNAALLSTVLPSVIIDGNNRVIYFHGKLDQFIQLPEGYAELNLITMLDSRLRARFRSGINKARKTNQRVMVRPLGEVSPQDSSFQALISPADSQRFGENSLVIGFEELAADKVSQLVIPGSARGLVKDPAGDAAASLDQETMIDSMERELIETREVLQNTIEELETSTEELKASHEESLATNEELQSSNEELEASSEELRSLNEELTTVNSQLKDKIDELSATHDDINNFFASTNLATVFLSQEFRLKRFTPAAARLLRIGTLDLNCLVSELPRTLIDKQTLEEAKTVLSSLEPSEKEIKADDGSWFVRKILPYQTEDRRIDGVVITYIDISGLKAAYNRLKISGQQQAVIAKLGMKALVTDDIDLLMDQMVREIAFTLDAEYCKVLECCPQQHRLLLLAGVGWDRGLVGTAYVPDDVGSQAGYTLVSGQPVVVDDLNTEKRFSGPQLLVDHKVISGISCVIETDRHPYGVLGVHSRKRRQFTDDDASFLMSAANILAVALQRKTTESELKDSEKRLRIAKDSNKMGSFEYFIDTGKIFWDDMLLDVWGFDTSDDVSIEDFYSGLHPEDRETVSKAIDASADPQGNGHYHVVYRVINRKNQQETWIEASGQVFFEHSKAVKMIGMVIDVSEQKKLQLSLHAAVEKQKEANQRKNEFLAILGHELRNPLAALSSGVQILQQNENKQSWALEMMDNNVRLIAVLLDDLLDLTRISRGQIKLNLQPVNINELISRVARNFADTIDNKHQQLIINLPDQTVVSSVDQIRIEQVVRNLLNNSIKFTPEGGQITIALSNPFADKFEISVQDTGSGLDMRYKHRIFEPFEQLNEPGSEINAGLGIGLSLVKQFVLLHHGSVEVESQGLGKGTKMTVTLPLLVENPSGKAIQPELDNPQNKADLSGLRVLVTDDNKDAAQGLSLMLELNGCMTETRYDAQSALSCCQVFEANVCILDIGLPDMDGFELLRQIKANTARPFYAIALTGFGHNEAKLQSKQAGFDLHINKPADLQLLLAALGDYKQTLSNSYTN